MTTLLGRPAAIIGLTLALPVAALAQAPKAGVVTTLHGTATVARASLPEPAPLKFRDDVFARDRITTGEHSIVRILLGGKAVVTVRERSDLTITETATTSTLEVGAGKIALAVNKDRMRPGESVDIKTPNAVAAIRGTTVIAEVTPAMGGTGLTSRFTLLTGLIDVTPLDPATGRPSGAAIGMSPLQTLSITGAAFVGAPRAITRREADAAASDLKIRLKAPSNDANKEIVDHQVQQAASHTAVLTGETVKEAIPSTNVGTDRGDGKVSGGSNGGLNARSLNGGMALSAAGALKGSGGLSTTGALKSGGLSGNGSLSGSGGLTGGGLLSGSGLTSGGLSGTGGLTSGGLLGGGLTSGGLSGTGSLTSGGLSGTGGLTSGGLLGGGLVDGVRLRDRLNQ